MKTTTPDHNSVVAKSNEIIGQLAGFGLDELRFLAFCIAHYDSRKPENRTFIARVEDLTRLFPMNEKSAYRVVRDTVRKINRNPFNLDNDGEIGDIYWFSSLKYRKKRGTFEFKLTEDIAPYLLGLTRTFTRYRLGDVYQFKSANSWRLYEHLKRWEAKGTWSVGLNELRSVLGVEGKYPRWNSFCQWLIEPALGKPHKGNEKPTGEINVHSDLLVSYEKEKHGRSIVALTFIIKSKPPEGTIDVETPQQELCRCLRDCGIHGVTALKFAQDADKFDKAQSTLNKLPGIKARWERKGPLQAYVQAAMSDEIYQMKLNDTGDKPKHDKAASQRRTKLLKDALACFEAGSCVQTNSEKCRLCQELVQPQ